MEGIAEAQSISYFVTGLFALITLVLSILFSLGLWLCLHKKRQAPPEKKDIYTVLIIICAFMLGLSLLALGITGMSFLVTSYTFNTLGTL